MLTNVNFRLELPTPKGQVDLSDDVVGDTAEDKEKAKKDAKRFRIVISSSDKERADGRPASVIPSIEADCCFLSVSVLI